MEIVVRIVGVYLFVVTLEVLFAMVCEVRGVDISVEGVGTFLWRGVG